MKMKKLATCMLAMFMAVAVLCGFAGKEVQAEEVDKNAPVIEYNKEYSHNLNNNGYVWYKVNTLNYSAVYNLHLKNIDCYRGATDPALYTYIYDADGREIAAWSKWKGADDDNWIKLQGNSTYYIKMHVTIWDEIGNFKFCLSYEADVSDTKEEATSYAYGTKLYENVKVNHDNDWYVIKTESYPAYYNIWVKNIDLHYGAADSPLHLFLYDADGSEKMRKVLWKGGEINQWIKLEPNSTYYIKMYTRIWDPGSYCFSISPEADVVDEIGATAPVLTNGVENAGTFRAKDDVDCFQFTTPKQAVVCDVTLKNVDASNITAEILDTDGVSVYKLTIASGKTETGKIKLKSNRTYYLKMSTAAAGNYNFTVTTKKESGDKKKQAETIKLKKNNARSIDSNDDVDWFKIKIKKTKKYKVTLKNINFAGGYKKIVKAYVYKGSKRVKTIEATVGKSKSSKIKMKKGTYYIKVVSDGASMGDYKLRVK